VKHREISNQFAFGVFPEPPSILTKPQGEDKDILGSGGVWKTVMTEMPVERESGPDANAVPIRTTGTVT
jgi:hypothetical protein